MTTENPIRLSALVVAHNEAAQIATCLDTLAFADEIVVVLDRCTDGTRDIAARPTRATATGSSRWIATNA
jgi:cellulose synthase/poly-beta-1,6-N-acetylglucosamine synthase-like glycosyltransferase